VPAEESEGKEETKTLRGFIGAVISVALAIGMLLWCLVVLEKNLDRRRKKPQWTSCP
jgi:hypothetical protein